MEIGERILLIETLAENNFYLDNVIQKIRKFGGNIVGVVILINQCLGEYNNLTANKENIMPVFNLFDIFFKFTAIVIAEYAS